jgi:hypothetical protein
MFTFGRSSKPVLQSSLSSSSPQQQQQRPVLSLSQPQSPKLPATSLVGGQMIDIIHRYQAGEMSADAFNAMIASLSAKVSSLTDGRRNERRILYYFYTY